VIDRRITAAAAALAILGLVLTGCVGAARDAGTGTVGSVGADATRSVAAAATPTPAATATAEPDGESNGPGETPGSKGSGAKGSQVTGADLDGIKKQLEAMQNEIDGLEMPGDNDFSGAEGAVY
jgi:hypothetical protein